MTAAERAALELLLRLAREDAVTHMAPEAGARERLRKLDAARAELMKEGGIG